MYGILSNFAYVALAAVALWGAFCVVLVLSRVSRKRFKSEAAQDAFLDSIEPALINGDFDAVQEACAGDERALSMMVSLACLNRGIGYQRVRQLVMDRFQRDVLADIDERLTWVTTVIKTAPMIGLFGTVLGMMGAFSTLATQANVEAASLAGNINVALITTALGLAIAVPLVIALASVNNRIRSMEELVAAGLTRFLDAFKVGLANNAGKRRSA
jgi:biopolymer transport protein ExbB/TolQ